MIEFQLPPSVQNVLDRLPSPYILLPGLFVIYQVGSYTYGFVRNLRAAQRSGIPYIWAPWYGFDRKFLATEPLWWPIASRLFPNAKWLYMIRADWSWYYRRAPFEAVGSDTVIMVNYYKNLMCTCDADVISQICARRNDFPKPIEVYAIMDIYGKNVVTVEGSEWRRHRKITGAQFNEKSNSLVWKESLFQAQEMMRCWKEGIAGGDRVVDAGRKGNVDEPSVIYELSRDAMKMTLGVISRAGFGVRCLWPSADGKAEEDAHEGAMSSTTVPPGHVMSYVDSLETLLHHLIAVLLLPQWFLKFSPFKIFRKIGLSFTEWGKYMEDLYFQQLEAAKTGESSSSENDGLDLMGAMVRSATSSKSKMPGLSQSEILGNSFVMFLAGHETAANSIHFAVLFLVCRPDVQRKLQAELDEIFKDAPADPKDWDYETYLPKLFGGWAGAIMNEQLRVLPPVVDIPKSTSPHLPPQPIKVNGKDCVIAPGTGINLNSICVHRNPKYWPAGPQRPEGPFHPSNTTNDLEEFKPERWFVKGTKEEASEKLQQDADKDTGVDLSPDTADSMFRPPKGAYIPFSEGFRACLGRRFAQVEILATLAVIFKEHSVEVMPEEGEDAIKAMSKAERRKVWDRERREIERKINEESRTVITLQMRGEPVKLRICKRGQELFDV
ncbi:uncharacterized protein PV09_08317 [Verruconis gallopava]|uniref:Cytochrome P450 n=1 Tax=Verruconis gallopava TaxID=253628 RepID=A0A0D2ALY6_9PEZI|nr:uncharacterized protein PV09_08317 [Verruconis gallopava]KIW00139.1 hypothetical protein PV09_08317 [Verruconis gallopava]